MKKIPFAPPDITELEIAEVVDALRSGWITTGQRTKLFEARLADYMGTHTVVCLNSQTASAEMTLRLLGIGPGDEVIVPAYTYTATASIVDHVGARIVMLDSASGSFEMDYDKLADAITPRTKVIIPVDIGGRLCDYDRIDAAIDSKRHLYRPGSDRQALFDRPIVMADSAHGLGGVYKGKMSGHWADFTTFSFHAVKNLTTAEGGAVTWRQVEGLDPFAFYREYMLLSLHGQDKDAFLKSWAGSWEYDIVNLGHKCNMTDVHASIGLQQLKRYPAMLARRHEIIRRYDEALVPLGIERLVHQDEMGTSSGHLYLARIPGIGEAERNDMIRLMADEGIACNVHYKPLPMMTAYRALGLGIADYPNAFAQYQNEITLPLYSRLTDDDVSYVIEHFSRILERRIRPVRQRV